MTDLPPVDGPPLPPPPTSDQRIEDPTAEDAGRPGRRRWLFVRSNTDRYLAGVAGGAGARLGVDPFFLRIGLAGLTLLLSRNGGDLYVLVPLSYLAVWLTLPTDTDRSLLARIHQVPALQEAAGAIAVFVVALVVIGRPSVVWAGVLFAVAALLLSRRPDHSLAGEPGPDLRPAEPVASSTTEAEAGERARASTWGRSLRGALGPRPITQTHRRPSSPKPRRSPALWPLTVSLLFAFGFVCALLDNLLDPGLDPSIVVNGSLAIIGGVLVLAARRGRAWITTLLILPLVPPWIAFSVADVPRFGDSDPGGAIVEAGSTLRWSKGYGEVYANLTDLDLPESGDITAEVRMTAGKADIWIPREAELHLVGRLGAGQLAVYLEEDFVDQDLDPLFDWGLDRTYRARGRECRPSVVDDDGLAAIATWSGVEVPTEADGEVAARAIADAGYPRPVPQIESYEDSVHDEVTGEPLYDADGNPRLETVETTTWTFQANRNDGLCLPAPPPDDPLRITVDATIGLGVLQIHRV